MSVISQREARRMRKRLTELEQAENSRRNGWVREYPGGVNIASVSWAKDERIPVAIRTARLLGHAVVVTADDGGGVRFFALPLGSRR